MEIELSPAINLLATALVHFRFYKTDDSVVEHTHPIMDFHIESFFDEYKRFKDTFYYGYDLLEFECDFPLIKEFFVDAAEVNLNSVELGEIVWAIHMPVTGFPAYIKGFEIY